MLKKPLIQDWESKEEFLYWVLLGLWNLMSEKALIDTIHAEIQMKAAQGEKDLILTPGNYGSDFISNRFILIGTLY